MIFSKSAYTPFGLYDGYERVVYTNYITSAKSKSVCY
jgi:hypothetical protein